MRMQSALTKTPHFKKGHYEYTNFLIKYISIFIDFYPYLRVFFSVARYIWFYSLIHFNLGYSEQSLLFIAITICTSMFYF